jgi:hypothetical protein
MRQATHGYVTDAGSSKEDFRIPAAVIVARAEEEGGFFVALLHRFSVVSFFW